MLQAKTRWDLKQTDYEKVQFLAEQLSISTLAASLLVNRGHDTVEKAKQFLYTDKSEFHDPFLMDGMETAVNRIREAASSGEPVLVYGDYDADGVSSTTVLMTALKRIGADAHFYIPNRFTEGYGPNKKAFRHLKELGFNLIITVDTGISALNEAKLAKELGIDLIITDHHEPGPVLPEAYAIIHPKKNTCPYPFKDLAGVGVAFKLAHALLGHVPEDLFEIAAIGTIADLVPLVGENRLLASFGIKKLASSSRPGVKALLKKCGLDGKEITEETIGFALGPRINAAGRLGPADPAVQLLMTSDHEEAEFLAEEIDALNKERQKLVGEMTVEAVQQVEEMFPPEENPVLVIAKEGWNPGVIGIVASRLVEKFYRPTIVLSIDREKGIAKGSARSIAGFDLFANLSTCRDILPHFGGHPMAAGMTLDLDNVDELRSRLCLLAEEVLAEEDFIPVTSVDLECRAEDVSVKSIEEMAMLAPFGVANPKPRVVLKDLSISSIRRIGSDGSHLKLVLDQDGFTLDSVGFSFGYLQEEVSPISTVSVLGELSVNEWNNMRKPQLMLQDMKVTEWQLFDIRGVRNIKKLIDSIPPSRLRLIVFNPATVKSLGLEEYQPVISFIETEEDARLQDLSEKYALLVDLPPDGSIIKALFTNTFPDRIYSLFYQEQNHFFSTMPNREHFKWYFAFLAKKSPFDLNKHGAELARYKGWSKETVDFMSQVFFELEFVTIDKGIIALSKPAKKRDLTESKTYRLKQQQIELENDYLYSSYHQLKSMFDSFYKMEETQKDVSAV